MGSYILWLWCPIMIILAGCKGSRDSENQCGFESEVMDALQVYIDRIETDRVSLAKPHPTGGGELVISKGSSGMVEVTLDSLKLVFSDRDKDASPLRSLAYWDKNFLGLESKSGPLAASEFWRS